MMKSGEYGECLIPPRERSDAAMKAMQPRTPQRAEQCAVGRSNIDERIVTAPIECRRCLFVASAMPQLLYRMSQAPRQMFRSRYSTLQVRGAKFAAAHLLQRRIDNSGWL